MGVFAKKNEKKQILLHISRQFFGTNLDFHKHPLHLFLLFSPHFPRQFIFKFFILDSWGVHTTLRTILDTLGEKPHRNDLSKLGTLKYECPQLLHSALEAFYLLKYDRRDKINTGNCLITYSGPRSCYKGNSSTTYHPPFLQKSFFVFST